MHGFPGTKCKIAGCENPVWPSKLKGLCGRHYQRSYTGRMLDSGELAPPTKIIRCASCGHTFKATGKAVCAKKYCENCREAEAVKVRSENSAGIYRRGKHEPSEAKEKKRKERDEHKILMKIANWLVSKTDSISRYMPLLEMHRDGSPRKNIAEKFGISRQRVDQIVKEYCSK